MSDLAAIDFALARRFGNGERAAAAAIALASWSVRAGHSGVPLAEFGRAIELSGLRSAQGEPVSVPEILEAIGRHPQFGPPETGRPLVVDQGMLYLRRLWLLEQEAAQRLRALAGRHFAVDLAAGRVLDSLLADTVENQPARRALRQSATSGLTLLCGGPGTGKTWTAARLLAFLRQIGDRPPRIAAAAPTGKAAARLGSSLQAQRVADAGPAIETLTVHRLLGSHPYSAEPAHDALNPLSVDVLLLDEASMIDLPMLVRLLRALPEQARLVLLGDPDQLPALGGGRVLADLLQVQLGTTDRSADGLASLSSPVAAGSPPREDSAAIRCVASYLTQSHRFADAAAVAELLAAVAAERPEAALDCLDAGSPGLSADWTTTDPLSSSWQPRWREGFGGLRADSIEVRLQALLAFRVLCAGNHGPRGVQGLNAAVELACFGRRRSGDTYDGQPILVTENAPRLDLWNGDLGVVARGGDLRLRAWFPGRDGRPRGFDVDSLPAHQTAYAMSVHKAQGSEFASVVLILPPADSPLLSRQWLYTGLSRARSSLAVCGDRAVFADAVTRRERRWTRLAQRLLGA